MVGIVRIALQRPYTFVVLALLIMIFGTLAALRTPTDIFPNIGIPVVSVVWTYNGLPPADMSGRVVYYYERALTTTVNDIEHIESNSMNSYGVVKIFFQPNVNINAAVAEVTAISQTVLKLLPPGITPPNVLVFNASSVPILQLALSSNTVPQMRLQDLAQNFIRPSLATVPGAAVPSPYGGKVRQVQIDINQHAMQSFHVSAQDVNAALAAQNLIIPVGTEKIGMFEYTAELNNAPTQIAELNNLPVKKVNGTVVYMHDVAYVHDSSPPQINMVRVDGNNAVLMTILKSGAASTLDIIADIKTMLPGIRSTLPKGIKLTAVGDQSVFVKDAVTDVLREGAIAGALTGLLILIFLGSWRSTLIITVSIPLSVLVSLTALSAIGETINVMTLGGLALAVGILVDEATVTIENINYHLEMGKETETAIMDGARQIVVPATVSLLAICIVFVPMFELSGVSGYLFRPLAEAVVFAMIGSYLLSRTLVPTMANYLLAGEHHGHEPTDEHGEAVAPAPTRNPFTLFHRGFERNFARFRAGYHDILAVALASPRIFISVFLGFVLASFVLVPFLGQDFFPTVDSGQIKLHVRGPTGMRIEETGRLFDRVEAELRRVIPANQLSSVVDNIGLPISGINMAYQNTGTVGPMDGDILVTLNENHSPTDNYIRTLRETLPKRFPGSTFAFLPADMTTQILNFGAPAPIDVQIAGQNAEGNLAYARKVLTLMRQVPGVADPRMQQAFNEPTLNVNVNRTLAGQVGLTERDVTNSLLTTLAGSIQTAPTFWLNPRTGVSYPIVVQMPQYNVDSISDLNNVPITGPNGAPDQILGGLATVVPTVTPAVVSHYNIAPAVDLYAAVQDRDLGGVASDIRRILDKTAADVPLGSTVALRGQAATMAQAYSQLIFGLGFSIVLIYLLIVVNFQSWMDPFVIITALPSALAGIVWMLFTTHTPLSVPALTGAIMCMGVATANSILVISFARERLADGLNSVDAALEAGFTRIRPVMMTVLAMVIGMLPTALSADQNAPLGRAVIGGLMFATISTLLFVPTVFSVVHRKKSAHATQNAPDQPLSSHA